MINLLLLLLAIPGLVLLYLQWKVMRQQEQLIETESKSLRQLRKKNKGFVDTTVFGLKPQSSYLQPSQSTSGLVKHRKKTLSGYLKKSRKKNEVL